MGEISQVMDIKLLPEEYQKKSSLVGGLGFSRLKSAEYLIDVWVVVSLILIVAAVAVYLGLFIYRNKLIREEKDLETQIVQIEEQRDLAMEANFMQLEKGIGDLKKILENRIYPSELFRMLEELTLSKVWYDNMKVDFSEVVLDLELATDSYNTLAEQAVIFQNDSRIKKVDFSGATLEKDGYVSSSFKIDLDPVSLRPTTTSAVKQ